MTGKIALFQTAGILLFIFRYRMITIKGNPIIYATWKIQEPTRLPGTC